MFAHAYRINAYCEESIFIILLVWNTGTATLAQAVIAANTKTIHDTRFGVITIDSAVTMMASMEKTTAQDRSR